MKIKRYLFNFVLLPEKQRDSEITLGRRIGFNFWYFIVYLWSYSGDAFQGPSYGVTVEF